MTEDRPKILVIDDVPANVMTLCEMLADDFELQFALSGTAGIALAAQAPQPDLILLDVLMPYVDGYQTCAQLKADPRLRDIPVIFVTALSADGNDERYGLALGAVDYITKPINIKIARLRIYNLLERERQRKEIIFYQQRLAELIANPPISPQQQQNPPESIADYDPLTGLPNSRLLIPRLNKAIAHAQRFGRMLAICHLAIDDCEIASDQLGYSAEDQLLIAVIHRLSTTLRQCDDIIKIDGSAFIIFISNIPNETICYEVIGSMLSALHMPFRIHNRNVTVTPILGLTIYPHDVNAKIEDLLHHAQEAMQQAKNTGKNSFVNYINFTVVDFIQ